MQLRLSLSGERPSADLCGRFAGVGLIRGEYLLRTHEEYVTVPACQARIADYLSWVAKLVAPMPVWYRTTELTTDEVNTLQGADAVLHEADPMKGLRGVRRGVAYPEAFETEVRVVADVARDHGNLHLMLPFVLDADEFAVAAGMADRAGWPNRIGSMVEIPSAVLDAERLIAEGASNLMIGGNDLSALMTGVSRAARDMKLHPAMRWAVERIREAAGDRVEWGLAGNLSVGVLAMAEQHGVPYVSLHYNELDRLLGIDRAELTDYYLVNQTKIKTRSQIAASKMRTALEPFGIVVP